jgi:hypothetical protein
MLSEHKEDDESSGLPGGKLIHWRRLSARELYDTTIMSARSNRNNKPGLQFSYLFAGGHITKKR